MCAWQSITYLLDVYFFVFFALTVLAIFVTGWSSLAAVATIEKRAGGTDWRKRLHTRWARDDDRPSAQELRGTGYAELRGKVGDGVGKGRRRISGGVSSHISKEGLIRHGRE